MSCVHPIHRAWLGSETTGAQNYDEFADEAEITQILTAQPLSALGVEMPHTAPDRRSQGFTENLEHAAERLQQAKDSGGYHSASDVVGVYRIVDDERGMESLGLFAMVDTDQISTNATEPGLVIRNEDVFVAKVAERVALAQSIGHLLSPVLLLQSGGADALREALHSVAHGGEEPDVVDVDQAGRAHQVWAVTGERAAALCELAQAGELVVADGNHRSLAAQTASLPSFLAVITTPDSLRLDPYQRLLTTLPRPLPELLDELVGGGAVVQQSDVLAEPTPGTVILYAAGQAWEVRLPADADAERIDAMDHSVVERLLITDLLGLDPGDPTIRYIGGDYSSGWLREQVDAGAADLAVLIAAVSMTDFVSVNHDRQKMPRKSTWFVPKARAGLVVAELG